MLTNLSGSTAHLLTFSTGHRLLLCPLWTVAYKQITVFFWTVISVSLIVYPLGTSNNIVICRSR